MEFRHTQLVRTLNIIAWRKQKDKLESAPKQQRAATGKTSALPDMEKDVLACVSERRQAGVGVSTVEIRIHARKLHRDSQAYKEQLPTFKASGRWCNRFMFRSHLSTRRRTTIAQKLPQEFEGKLINYQRYIIRLRKKHGYELGNIANADQTPLTFDLPYSRTATEKGSKKVILKSSGNEKT